MDTASICDRLKAGSAALRAFINEEIGVAMEVDRPRIAAYLQGILHEKVKPVPAEHATASNLGAELTLLSAHVSAFRTELAKAFDEAHPFMATYRRWNRDSEPVMRAAVTALAESCKVGSD